MEKTIWFVGMKYYGGHCFSSKDIIRLELEDDNAHDRNAVKVMVFKENSWVHVAYCDRESAKKVRKLSNFDNLTLILDEYYPQSVKFIVSLNKDTPVKATGETDDCKDKLVEAVEIDKVVEKLETLNIKPLLTRIAKNVPQIRAMSIDDLRVGTVLKVKAIKEYTYRNVRKVMVLSNERYYYSNCFMEDALQSIPDHCFEIHIIAPEPVGNQHNKVKIAF